MDDKTYEAQQLRVKRLHQKWLSALGLRWWKIKSDYYRGDIEITGHQHAIFTIYVRFKYQDIQLHCSLGRIQDLTDIDLEDAYVHELGHVFTIPLKAAAMGEWNDEALDDLEEHQATAVGRAFAYLWGHVAAQSSGFPLDEY